MIKMPLSLLVLFDRVLLSDRTWDYRETCLDKRASCMVALEGLIRSVRTSKLMHSLRGTRKFSREQLHIRPSNAKMLAYILTNVCFVFRKFIMSHHIVTVCVVCVLCAAHIPCSAHTNLTDALHASPDSLANQLNAEGEPFWTLMRSKDSHSKDPSALSTYPHWKDQHRSHSNNNFVSNKRDNVRFHSTRHLNNKTRNNNNNNKTNVPVIANAMRTASHDDYLEKERIAENLEHSEDVRDTHNLDTSVNSRDARLLVERLILSELSDVNHKSVQSSEDLRTVTRSRLKRDVAVDDKYFMSKIFEAYGDGTSVTMDGFEKLVRKLGLLRLLTESSELEDGGTERSTHTNHTPQYVIRINEFKSCR